MNMNILSMTAMFTLILNVFLTVYLLRDKTNTYPYHAIKDDVINFVLTPDVQSEIAADEHITETEIILSCKSYNG
jgi:hypothetical protein